MGSPPRPFTAPQWLGSGPGLALMAALVVVEMPPAQTPAWSVDAVLAADPERTGPPAWVWFRDAHLRDHAAAGGAAVDPLEALRVRWDPSGLTFEPSDHPPESGCHLQASARLGPWTVWIAGDSDGTEDWVLEGPTRGGAHPAAILGLRLGQTRLYHVPSLVGAHAPGGDLADPDTLFLAAIAGACGETEVTCSRADDGAIRVRGSGGGGLLLPAIAGLLARSDGALDLTPEPLHPTRHWLLMALAARGEYREEAVRQLTVCAANDPTVNHTLERLLLVDDWSRVLALRALGDRGAVAALPRIAAALSDPSAPDAVASARSTLGHLWPHAPAGLRRTLRQSPAVSAALDPNAGDPLPASDAADGSAAGAAGSLRWLGWVWVLVTSVLCFALRSRVGSRLGTQPGAGG